MREIEISALLFEDMLDGANCETIYCLVYTQRKPPIKMLFEETETIPLLSLQKAYKDIHFPKASDFWEDTTVSERLHEIHKGMAKLYRGIAEIPDEKVIISRGQAIFEHHIRVDDNSSTDASSCDYTATFTLNDKIFLRYRGHSIEELYKKIKQRNEEIDSNRHQLKSDEEELWDPAYWKWPDLSRDAIKEPYEDADNQAREAEMYGRMTKKYFTEHLNFMPYPYP